MKIKTSTVALISLQNEINTIKFINTHRLNSYKFTSSYSSYD